jgi:hypothetical protein
MTNTEIDEQIKRLQGYLEYSTGNLRGKLMPTTEHVAIEQALALAYIARELAKS